MLGAIAGCLLILWLLAEVTFADPAGYSYILLGLSVLLICVRVVLVLRG